MGIRFELTSEALKIYRPDGQQFFTFLELEQRAKQAEERAQQAETRIQRLEQRLRDAGIDPDQL